MKILSVNAGSSTLKSKLFEMPEEKVLIAVTFERIGQPDSFYTINVNGNKIRKEGIFNNHGEAVEVFLKELIALKIISSINEIDGIGHRVVHGGNKYSKSVIINDEVISDIEELSSLAPLHNPAHILGIIAFSELLPNTLSVAVFDTAFHQTMGDEAYIYPVPYEWYTNYGIRKYGFHGISHKYLSERISKILNRNDLKVITCHLGNGSSISAIKDGKCIDTSMGFTPLAGVPMGTRSGDIDPSIIEYIMNKTGKSITEITNELNKNSGFLGVSGISSDSRDIEAGISVGNKRCALARDIFTRKVVAYISAYNSYLDGADVIVFSAGLGENGPEARKEIIRYLEAIGVIIDDEMNKKRGEECLITASSSKIMGYVIPTNEELEIARETYELSL